MKGELRELALFAGAGGGILGGLLLGWRTVCAVEIDAYCRSVLLARQRDGMLGAFPLWDDVRTFDAAFWRGHVDVVSGGFPCQDISSAGRGAGLGGDRSGLWFEMLRVIGEVRPAYVFAENSPNLRTRGLDVVLSGLAGLGFDAAWGVLGAWHAGSPHRRDRMWIAASHPDRCRERGFAEHAEVAGAPAPSAAFADPGGERRPARPGRARSGKRHLGLRLLPTPTAVLYGSNQGGAAGRTGPKRGSLETQAGGVFIALREWMMGWPIGWSASGPLATDRFHEWLRSHGRPSHHELESKDGDTMTATSTRERSLTPPEVQDRTAVLLHLLDEQDTIRFRVRASRDELREWRVEARKLATQIDEVRQEIRTGIVTEPAQQDLPHMEKPPARVWPEETEDECSARTVREEMAAARYDADRGCFVGIDGSSDEPDEETDPPPPDPYWGFNANYPKAENHVDLWAALQEALTPAEYAKLVDGKTVASWHRSSGQFEAVAHWARVENAHKSHATRAPTPGITVPARFPMPLPLAQALAESQPKKPVKAQAEKKKRTRKAAP